MSASALASDKMEDSLQVSVQYAAEELESEEPPSSETISGWAKSAYLEQRLDLKRRAVGSAQAKPLAEHNPSSDLPAEVSVRIVDEAEMIELNGTYRDQAKATNVLSFPASMPGDLMLQIMLNLLGDIVICHKVIVAEANQQHKSVNDHYAHMVVHGLLHLCGYDHQQSQAASEMENLETKILHGLGIANPYC